MNDQGEAQQARPVKQVGYLYRMRWIAVLLGVFVVGLICVGVGPASITRLFWQYTNTADEARLRELGFSLSEPSETHRDEVYVIGKNNGLTNGTDLQEAIRTIPYSIALKLDKCEQLESLSAVANPKVVEMHVMSCNRLVELWRPGALPGLREINLARSGALTNLRGCSELAKLEELAAPACAKLNDLSGLAELPALRFLNFSNCDSLTNVDVGGELTTVTSLEVEGCTKLTSLSGLRQMPGLDYLDISGCSSLKSLATLPKLSRLKTLVMCDNKGMGDVASLKSLTSLREVYVGRYLKVAKSVEAVVGPDCSVRRSCPL